MAAKKKNPEPEVEALPQEPATVSMTKDELMRLQLAQFQVRAFDAEMQLEMINKDAYLRKIDPAGKLNEMVAAIRSRNTELVRAKSDFEAVVKEIEARLGIVLKEFAYDDVTGNLNKLP